MTPRLALLSEGRPPPPHVDLFLDLFSDRAAAHAFALFREQNPLAGALSGNPTVDAWRAWLDAREALAQARPWDALQRLKRLAVAHGWQDGSLAAVEVSAVVAECLTDGNQPLDAIDAWEQLRDQLLGFAERAAGDPDAAAEELKVALEELTGARGLTVSSDALVGSWALGRGLPLLLDIGVRDVGVLEQAREEQAARATASRIEDDVSRFHSIFGLAFGERELEKVQFALGNAWTALDTKRALQHFSAAGGDTGENLTAAVNLANCLLRLGRFGEARARYADLESAFELAGAYLDAARVWAGECIADWKDRHDPSIRDSLVGAVKLFEKSLPDTADPATLYMLKQFNEPALTLLVAVIADCDDRSDDRLEELLSALWALQRPELKADLERDTPEEAGWAALFARQSSRLEITKAMMEPFPETRVVHLCAATDELVFVAYGYDDAQFRLETSVLGESGARSLTRFLELLDEQLAADLRRDESQLTAIGEELAACGDALGAGLSPALADLLGSAAHLYYMPHAYGSVDLFPLGGLRLEGKWLAEMPTISRSPTPNHLRETLSPTRPAPGVNRVARVVKGDPEAGPTALRQLEAEAGRAVHILGVLGFDAAPAEDPNASELVRLLDGGAGIVHYVGHGLASDVYEGLPLHSGDVLRPVHLDALPGFTTGFVFLCACDAAAVRYGAGGYQTGIASRLVERGAPAVVAFTQPMLEERAGAVVRELYPQAAKGPLGAAVREAQRGLAGRVPAYAWLSVAAYGDPEVTLPGIAGQGEIGTSSAQARTWHSAFRTYAVLRTDEARSEALDVLDQAPEQLRRLARELIETAFSEPPASAAERLAELDSAALACAPPGAGPLSLHAAVVLERAHGVGMDEAPIRFPEPGDETRELYGELVLLAQIGASLFDTRLNGLAHALLGRLLAWDQGNIQHAAVPLREARDKLREAAPLSPFVTRIHQETEGIIRQFGG
jgi:hypothetical protein